MRRIAEVREQAARFIGAASADEIVFTPGATAGLNAVALSWGLANLADGDEILYSPHDHTSNVYPWVHLRQLLARFGRPAARWPGATPGCRWNPGSPPVRYLPHWQSAQVQFAQVQLGLSQLRAVSPHAQFTQLHGSQVHAGFSQVMAVLMAGLPLCRFVSELAAERDPQHGTTARSRSFSCADVVAVRICAEIRDRPGR